MGRLPLVAVATFVVAIAGHLAAVRRLARPLADRSRTDARAAGAQRWLDARPDADHRLAPAVFRADRRVFQTYRNGDRTVVLYLAYYRHQVQGSELVTSQNIMVVQKHPVWQQVGERLRTETLAEGPTEIKQTLLRSPVQRLIDLGLVPHLRP